jgi:hypothetical protein
MPYFPFVEKMKHARKMIVVAKTRSHCLETLDRDKLKAPKSAAKEENFNTIK